MTAHISNLACSHLKWFQKVILWFSWFEMQFDVQINNKTTSASTQLNSVQFIRYILKLRHTKKTGRLARKPGHLAGYVVLLSKSIEKCAFNLTTKKSKKSTCIKSGIMITVSGLLLNLIFFSSFNWFGKCIWFSFLFLSLSLFQMCPFAFVVFFLSFSGLSHNKRYILFVRAKDLWRWIEFHVV